MARSLLVAIVLHMAACGSAMRKGSAKPAAGHPRVGKIAKDPSPTSEGQQKAGPKGPKNATASPNKDELQTNLENTKASEHPAGTQTAEVTTQTTSQDEKNLKKIEKLSLDAGESSGTTATESFEDEVDFIGETEVDTQASLTTTTSDLSTPEGEDGTIAADDGTIEGSNVTVSSQGENKLLEEDTDPVESSNNDDQAIA